MSNNEDGGGIPLLNCMFVVLHFQWVVWWNNGENNACAVKCGNKGNFNGVL